MSFNNNRYDLLNGYNTTASEDMIISPGNSQSASATLSVSTAEVIFYYPCMVFRFLNQGIKAFPRQLIKNNTLGWDINARLATISRIYLIVKHLCYRGYILSPGSSPHRSLILGISKATVIRLHGSYLLPPKAGNVCLCYHPRMVFCLSFSEMFTPFPTITLHFRYFSPFSLLLTWIY